MKKDSMYTYNSNASAILIRKDTGGWDTESVLPQAPFASFTKQGA